MEVFISWSGTRSQAVANALRSWLPKLINALQPWLSSADIDKGARWSRDVASRLSSAKAGIICLTPGNLHAEWIHFEAGALSKTLESTYVCTLLVGLKPSELEPPLAQFQATRAEKDDIFNLLKTLNAALGDKSLPESHLSEAFEVWWPKLKSELDNLPTDDAAVRPERSEKQLLEEILNLVREQNRSVTNSLSDEDRSHIIEGRAKKLIFSNGNIASMSTVRSGNVLTFEVSTRNGGRYSVLIPTDAHLDGIDRVVQAQIPGPNVVSTESSLTEKPFLDPPKFTDLDDEEGK